MKTIKNLFLITALCLAPIAHVQAAEPASAPVETHEFVLNNAQQFSVKSHINGREYHIFVEAPQGEAPAEGFPVVYASDGNAMFPQIAATANLLRMNNRAVFVGIGYPGDTQFDTGRRYFDLTPKTPDDVLLASGRGGANRETGGNDLFFDFIEKELKPIIESRYKINPQKQTLFGHSLGGLFVLHVLFNHPEAFQNYVAAAPSIWWNNQSILEEQKTFLAKYQNQTLQLNVLITSNTDPSRQRPTPAQAEANAAAKNTRQDAMENAGSIVENLKKITGITAQYKVFENETHISMVPGSINSALRFALGDSRRSQTAPPANAARGGVEK
jgi:predicted alpha/beta superfamily hydrolase